MTETTQGDPDFHRDNCEWGEFTEGYGSEITPSDIPKALQATTSEFVLVEPGKDELTVATEQTIKDKSEFPSTKS